MSKEQVEANRRRWDELVPIHASSRFYDVEGFKRGRSTLLPVEIEELGDLKRKRLLHLQCHFGLDTLSLARNGALVTGVDYSKKAISLAKDISLDVGIEARFIESGHLRPAFGPTGGVRHRFHVIRRPMLASRPEGLGLGREQNAREGRIAPSRRGPSHGQHYRRGRPGSHPLRLPLFLGWKADQVRGGWHLYRSKGQGRELHQLRMDPSAFRDYRLTGRGRAKNRACP